MADIGAMVDELVEAGCRPGVAAKVVHEAFLAGKDAAPYRDDAAARRRERDRAYQKAKRRQTSADRRQTSADRRQTSAESPPKESFPHTPFKEITPSVDADEARAHAKLIRDEAFAVSDRALAAMGVSQHDPVAVGAPMTIQGWLAKGWTADGIITGIERCMANRKGKDPPRSLNYFVRAIADVHAELSAPLPTGQVNNAKAKSGGSIVEAVKRQLANLESDAGCDDPAADRGAVLRISHG